MAKRLTDTDKWKNPAFRKLPNKYKILYLYLLDNCDSAGVMHLDLELIGFLLGDVFPVEEIKSLLGHRLIFVADDKVVIRNFIAFQNGDITDPKNRVAVSIRATLASHGLLERYLAGEFGTVQKSLALWDTL